MALHAPHVLDSLWDLTRAMGSEQPRAGNSAETPLADALDCDDVRRSLQGDGEAYRSLVERHQQQIAAMMWRFSRDSRAHEELVQDVFVEAYKSLGSFRGAAPFSHWLARVATHVGYQYWRAQTRERRHPKVPVEDWHAAQEARVDAMSPEEAAEWVHDLLAQLPPRDRIVLTFRFLEEQSVEETARRTGWSETMVKVQTWRARQRLRQIVAQRGERP